MTILIFVLIAFGILNIIHHITMIEQLKEVKRNQSDIIKDLNSVDRDVLMSKVIIYEVLKDIERSIDNIS